MRKMFFLMLVCALGLLLQGEVLANNPPVVSNVTASQRTDGSNLVDIRYNLYDADGDLCTVWVLVSRDSGATFTIPLLRASGDFGENMSPGANKHIVWNAGLDVPGLSSSTMRVRVYAHDGKHSGIAEMCYVPAGTFRTSAGVQVFLSSYYIDKYEVTNLLYCSFLNSGGKDNRWRTDMQGEIGRSGEAGNYTYHAIPGFENRPVRYVTWHDAVAFCNWRSTAEGLPEGTYHLPTEAQWEKAAGWDPVEEKLWKYGIRSDTITTQQANYANSVGTTTDVGSYHPWKSYYGLYDASGNVWEWCSDWYGGTYPSGTSDPTGPSSGTYKVFRGGSWHGSASCVETGHRGGYTPSSVSYSPGFRCARTLE